MVWDNLKKLVGIKGENAPVTSNTNTSPTAAKVLFRVPNEDGSATVETLWADNLGNDHYKLDNSPFFAYSVSWQDVVYAPFSPEEQFPTFQRVVCKSGNRTVRVIFDRPLESGNQSDVLKQGLIDLGCSYEGVNKKMMSVTVPHEVELNTVRSYLIERHVQWEHADPTYDELFPSFADEES